MRASRGWSLLGLVVVLGLLGPPASASASDDGLRAVVRRDVAVEKRLDAAGKRVRAPSSKSFSAYVRFLRRLANYDTRVSRNVVVLRRRYAAQRPQTADAARGRTLLLRGDRDVADAAHRYAAVLHLGIRQMSHARSDGAYRQAYRRMIRSSKRLDALFRRGNSRIGRGRKLILHAPAPAAPAPGTATPTAPTTTTPTPTTPAPTSPAPGPPSLLPSLPSLLGL